MNAWAWIAAYVVGFAFLQLLVYRYLGRKTGGTTSPAAPDAAGVTAIGADSGGDETVRCGDCGAVNDSEPGYRFCRECSSRLS
jgi:hypothetical protein